RGRDGTDGTKLPDPRALRTPRLPSDAHSALKTFLGFPPDPFDGSAAHSLWHQPAAGPEPFEPDSRRGFSRPSPSISRENLSPALQGLQVQTRGGVGGAL